MKLAVITPVGPGHEGIVWRAKESVLKARSGPFTVIRHEIVVDPWGKLGRSRARNIGIEHCNDADWYFFLDADDRLRPDALTRNDFESPATFGAVSIEGRITDRNHWPCTWRDVALRGATGTLSMGLFCKASLGLRFNENLDAGEDFEFYMRLPGFTKRREPLVDIGRKTPPAGGPRGYEALDWTTVCNREVVKAVERNPSKYDLRGNAVLEKAPRSRAKLGELSKALPERGA